MDFKLIIKCFASFEFSFYRIDLLLFLPFWSSYIRSIYVLCPGGMVLEMTLLSLCLEPSGNSFLTLLSLIVVLDRFRIFGKSFLQLNSISTSNHIFGRMIWDKLPECIFKNFENARVKGEQFQNFQKSRGWIIP